MIKIGLTGSIGMGKSTVAMFFAELGAAVWNADDAVHRMYAKDGIAVPLIAAAFPSAVVDGVVDRMKLAELVLGVPANLRRLEDIVHPLVGQDRAACLAKAEEVGADLLVLDIPLLFEGGGDSSVDVTVVVSAPEAVQRARVLARPGLSEEKLQAILKTQLPDAEKRARADYIIDTNLSLEETRQQVTDLVSKLREGNVH